jgi:hypothetical protein
MVFRDADVKVLSVKRMIGVSLVANVLKPEII